MRYSIIALVAGLSGCAYGGPTDAERARVRDAGAFEADASPETEHDGGPASHGSDAGPATHHDAGATSSGHDAGTAVGYDAGTATGYDAGTTTTGTDAGTSETDSGASTIDAGPAMPGDSCGTAVDVSAGGTWMVDTCALRDHVAASCGVAGTRDVVLHGLAPMTGSTYQLHVGAGWVIQQLDAACTPTPYECGASDWGVSGATFDPYWVWAVESADGSCGMATIMVTRVM